MHACMQGRHSSTHTAGLCAAPTVPAPAPQPYSAPSDPLSICLPGLGCTGCGTTPCLGPATGNTPHHWFRHLPHLLFSIQLLHERQGKLKGGAGAPVCGGSWVGWGSKPSIAGVLGCDAPAWPPPCPLLCLGMSPHRLVTSVPSTTTRCSTASWLDSLPEKAGWEVARLPARMPAAADAHTSAGAGGP